MCGFYFNNHISGDIHGLSFNNNCPFAAYDRDATGFCANLDKGGWWYYQCAYANLNGEYIIPGTIHTPRGTAGMTYYQFDGFKSLQRSQMMFRPV